MKKTLFVCFVLVFVCAMFVPQAMAGKDVVKIEKVKVDICHLNSGNDELSYYVNGVLQWTMAFGKVKSVSESALPAHLEHGDDTAFADVSPFNGKVWNNFLESRFPTPIAWSKLSPKPSAFVRIFDELRDGD